MLVLLCKEAFPVCLVHWEQMLCKLRDGQWVDHEHEHDRGCLHDWVCFPVHVTMSVEIQCSVNDTNISESVSDKASFCMSKAALLSCE